MRPKRSSYILDLLPLFFCILRNIQGLGMQLNYRCEGNFLPFSFPPVCVVACWWRFYSLYSKTAIKLTQLSGQVRSINTWVGKLGHILWRFSRHDVRRNIPFWIFFVTVTLLVCLF